MTDVLLHVFAVLLVVELVSTGLQLGGVGTGRPLVALVATVAAFGLPYFPEPIQIETMAIGGAAVVAYNLLTRQATQSVSAIRLPRRRAVAERSEIHVPTLH